MTNNYNNNSLFVRSAFFLNCLNAIDNLAFARVVVGKGNAIKSVYLSVCLSASISQH